MTVRRIEVYSVSFSFYSPLRTASGTCQKSESIIVKIITDDGLIGYGEASPTTTAHESSRTILGALDRLAGLLGDADTTGVNSVIEKMDLNLPGNPSAKAAIDIALHDILGQKLGKPLFALFGGFRGIQTDITLSSGIPQIAQEARNAVIQGFKALKIKVAIPSESDFEKVQTVRNSAGPDISLRIDANQGWKPDKAIEILNRLEPLGVEFVEQPIKANDHKGLRKIRKHTKIPVMADESVCSPKDAKNVIRNEAVDLINVKLMKCGGILKAKEIAEIAQEANVPCMLGCMAESNIGITAAVHLASALANIKFADLDSDILLKERLVVAGGADMNNSNRFPPRGSGLGIVKINDKLLSAPIRRYVF
jgi:o-succinylbenzoate synthase